MRNLILIGSAVALLTAILAAFFWITASPLNWRQIQPEAAFGIRDTAQPFVLGDKYWISNGYLTNSTVYRDLWSSADGVDWQQEVAATPYDPYSAIAVHNGRVFAAKNSVWASDNGKDWSLVSENGPTDAVTALPMMRSFKGRLWFFHFGEVWSSADGSEWRKEDAPFGRRSSFAVEVFNDSLWLIGGGLMEPASPPEVQYPERTAMNDVWRSSDGYTWELVTASAPWKPRMWPSTVVYDGRLYVVGGFSNRDVENFSDIWSSANGSDWSEVVTPNQFPARHWVSLFAVSDGIMLVAGNGWPLTNDVWRINLAKWWEFWRRLGE